MAPGDEIRNALAAADELMRRGRPDDAARQWELVLSRIPEHPDALFHLGQHALYRKDLGRARSLFERALAAAPSEPAVALNLAFVFRAAGDPQGELAALTKALVIDPYFYPALLAKAQLIERLGQKRRAARIYKDALTTLPPEEQLPPALRGQVERARAAVAEDRAAFTALVDGRLAVIKARHGGARLERIDECRDIMLGLRKPQVQQPHMLHFPKLAPITFHERAAFPWLAQLEAGTEAIRDELLALLAADDPGIRPYLAHPDGAPLEQWAELNRSLRWSAYFLWEGGKRIDAHCRRCPRTAEIVASLPLCDQPGFAPTVNFSILKPHTTLPPHSGDTNTRLIVHLPLVIPPGCWFRVGNDTREWRYGEAFVFDDTIEHEAHNDSDLPRAILMLDIWNPALTPAERDLVAALLLADREYYQ